MESVYPPEQRDLDLCIGGFGSGRVGLGCWSLGRGRHACIIYLPWQGRQAGRLAAGSFTFLSLLLVGWHFPPPNLMKQTIFSCCSVFGFVIFMAFLYGVEHPYLFCFFFFLTIIWVGKAQQHSSIIDIFFASSLKSGATILTLKAVGTIPSVHGMRRFYIAVRSCWHILLVAFLENRLLH